MSYTFRVIFDGVCAHVPDHPFFSRCDEEPKGDKGVKWRPNTVNEVDVLLPDLTRAEYNSQPVEGLRVFRSPHLALLQFSLPDLHRKTTRRIDLVTRDIGTRDESGLLYLKREQIRFRLQAENATSFRFADWSPADLDDDDRSRWWFDKPDHAIHVPRPTAPKQLESLWWLPRLQEIAPKYAQVRPDVLSTHAGPFPEELQARVEIKGGFLKTFDFNRNVNGDPQPWRFLPAKEPSGTGKWNRAIGNRQALEFYDVRGPVTIELKRIANDVHTTELVLNLPPGAYRPVLEVVISNREPESLFGVQDRLTAQLPDPDFEEFYYMLSAETDMQYARPVPNPLGFGLLGIRDKPCSPTAMAR